MDSPVVSVGLQFFNSESTLRQAIQSILQQTYTQWELILHDDGSQDRSAEVARTFQDPRIHLFHDSTNRKRPYRLNQSLEIARGRFYAVMDGDDIAYPDRLEKQVRLLKQRPDVHLVGGGMMVFSGNGFPIGKRQPPTQHEQICARPWSGFSLGQPTFMGRTDWFRKYRYREGVSRAEDQDLLLRSYRNSQFANISDLLVGYREAQLRWQRIVVERFWFSRGLYHQFRAEGHLGLALAAISVPIMKAGVDAFAVATGLNYRILRHRAGRITDEERQRWQQVYQTVCQ